ncbi:MAG: L-histidine N(alpha)-methyltransferase [Cellvibrionaceae bacterium]
MSSTAQNFIDESDVDEVFLADVVEGLSKPQKTLPCKYFYDERGSQLFEKICETPEYYVTRTECRIYEDYAEEMSALIGSRALIIEPGAGSVKKITLLLEQLKEPAGFIPMDISEEILQLSCDALARQFPLLDITPVVIDFLNGGDLRRIFSTLPAQPLVDKRVIFFPGSTIGNFHPEEAQRFLKQFADNLQPGDGLLIGVDIVKELSVLEDAYNDAEGVTAGFNLNLLHRINNELAGELNVNAFNHQAIFNQQKSRIEMHIISAESQEVQIGDQSFTFSKGESIHTENSYKYSIEMFSTLAQQAGFRCEKVWQDNDSLFSVGYYSVV